MIKTTQKIGKVTVVSLQGSLELSQQEKFKETLLKQVTGDPCSLVINLKEVDFIDSTCLGALIAVARRLRERGGDVKLSNMTPEVRSIFQITRLEKVFEIFEGIDDAVSAYKKA